ncbi:MAG: dTDP-glucose 4,6-dehydratase [Phycisphaerae bacterium]|jgi:dTDP-glucose 4,6-dehydratase
MQTILVTGGAGFIGSNFVRHVLAHAPDVAVVNLDLLTYAGSRANLTDLPAPERHTLIVGDIADQPLVQRLLSERHIRHIVHFAAESHVDRSIDGPRQFLDTNIMGTFTLLEAARHVWLADADGADGARFHHVSTDEVYGTLGPDDPAFTETTPYAPNSPYAASKAASDHLVRAYAHTYGLPVSISSCSNNYGPRQFPEKFIPVLILNALAGRPLPIYGDGRQIRDWLHVDDHCAAIWRILEAGEPGRTYNIGGGNQPTNLSIVQQICTLLDEMCPDSPYCPHEQLLAYVADRPGHDRRYAMATARIESDLGWRPRWTLEAGLRQTVHWYLDHAEWVQAIREQGGYQRWMKKNYARRQALQPAEICI